MSKLEKKWWFAAAASFVSTVLTIPLMISAGVWPASGMARWVVYFFCFVGIWRCVSFMGSLVILFAWPSSRALGKH